MESSKPIKQVTASPPVSPPARKVATPTPVAVEEEEDSGKVDAHDFAPEADNDDSFYDD